MPLLFTQFCDLLTALEEVSRHVPSYSPTQSSDKYKDFVESWFRAYNISIQCNTVDPTVLLSSLFPARRTDRVFNLQVSRLSRQLRGCLGLGCGRWEQLQDYQKPGRGDLGDCVERVLRQSEFEKPSAANEVTLWNVDQALARIASRCSFSGSDVRSFPIDSDSDTKTSEILTRIYRRLQSREAKWFTRMLLKDHCDVNLDIHSNLVHRCIDPLLPLSLRMHDNFQVAVTKVRELSSAHEGDPAKVDETSRCENANRLKPQLGTKVSGPLWAKAKGGITHATSMINGRTMSVERKHDGEYCQIHVDMSKGDDCIQLFSKSGKDSTEDRRTVLHYIKRGLGLERGDAAIRRNCILEGELLVWSDKDSKILPFHKIRKHVARSGRHIGTSVDSQPHAYEKLMVIFYEVMLLNDDPVLHWTYQRRRQLLQQIVSPIKGRVGIVQQRVIHFSNSSAAKQLRKALAVAFAHRWEGLVLKPYEEPYFSGFNRSPWYLTRWIKLKKDCISGLGDTADFAVIGAGYDAKRAAEVQLPEATWTHFFIGCLKNKLAVRNRNEAPEFVVVDCVSQCIGKADLKTLNQRGKFVADGIDEGSSSQLFKLEMLYMDSRLPKMTTLFRCPFVFDVAGSGFDKGSNRKIFTLRFPRVVKIKWDMDWRDCVDYDQLQIMADKALKQPSQDIADEVSEWDQKLRALEKGTNKLSWASTFEDSEDAEAEDVPHLRKDSPRKRKGQACGKDYPILVRMDSAEMHDNEHRLDNGTVAEAADDTMHTTQSKSVERGQHISLLQQNGNPVIPQPVSYNTTFRRADGASMENFDLVPKMPQGPNGNVDVKAPKRRRIMETPSPAQRSTGDGQSTLTSTQRMAIYNQSSPTPTAARKKNAQQLATPPPTAERDLTFKPPRLEDCTIVLAPSLRTPHARLSPFLDRLGDDGAAPKVKQWSYLADFLPLSGNNTGEDVLYLVDPWNADVAGTDLLALIQRMDLLQLACVSVWNWRLLERLEPPGNTEAVDEKSLQECYLLKVCYRYGAEGRERLVKLVWRDGTIDERAVPFDQ
ncbi:MAG: hypothetical protein OHK93_004023 [Ramalina farinacea]|uniref:ATP-dependent DNA ligase family profile domain-containing protein n=1 Tax=Ramalina farinacea TaxID=258253 RepID=A0AA43TSB9_9LECA|nr:hypothetical protein [Ramalina farinacea]